MSLAANYLVNRSIFSGLLKYFFILLLASCLVADFYLARRVVPDADTIQNYAQLLSVRGGNIFLRHWILSSDNDYFTDLLFFVVFSFVFGKGLNLVFIVPFFVYCLFLSCCMIIVARAAESRAERYFGLFLVLFLLGLPYGPWLHLLFQSSIHTGTITLCLCAIVIAQPVLSGRPFKCYMLVPFTVLVFAISASDPFAIFFFLSSLPVLIILRAWLFRKLRAAEWALFGCAILGSALGIEFISILSHNGGFSTAISFQTTFVTTMQGLERNAYAVVRALQILFTARVGILGSSNELHIVASTRLITAIFCALLCLLVIWHMPRSPRSGVAQFFVLGAASLAVANSLSGFFSMTTCCGGPNYPNTAIRYVTPIYVFVSLAAVMQFQRSFFAIRNKTVRMGFGGIIALAALPFFGAGCSGSYQRCP